MIPPSYIANYAAVVDFYGYWPSFHDAEVLEYQEPSAENRTVKFTLHTWQMTDQVDSEGYFVLQKHALISFHFAGIHDADMDSFRSDNILFGLNFIPPDELSSFRVELDSVMDMSGAFSATSGEVTSIRPCNPDGIG